MLKISICFILLPSNGTGLVCYSCNTDGVGPDCIENPNKYTTVQCVRDDEGNLKDYCYTTRLEDTDPETGEQSKLFQNISAYL